uniref:Putative clathrin assembly protein At2g01600 n=1 Tax=Rhizophora mucronata TaxID=61149 RepID=A0A2P2QF37_RHIMU
MSLLFCRGVGVGGVISTLATATSTEGSGSGSSLVNSVPSEGPSGL